MRRGIFNWCICEMVASEEVLPNIDTFFDYVKQ